MNINFSRSSIMHKPFPAQQFSEPHIAKANEIVTSCVQCGLCTATCPTYALLGDERDGPRGRIYMIKDMLNSDQPPSPTVRHHVDRCLSCFSCMTACPSDVDYMHLVDIARTHLEKTSSRSLKTRFIRGLLAFILPYPFRFQMALLLAVVFRPIRQLFPILGLPEIKAMLDLARGHTAPKAQFSGGGIAKPYKYRTKRVVLFTGCVQRVLRPQINDATLRLLAKQGVEVIMPAESQCCGALVQHMGKEKDALEAARHNVDVWYDLMRNEALDAILINTSGCGTSIKDYGYLLQNDPAYARRAQEVSKLAVDITEFLANYDQDAPQGWSSIKVAYHGACSLEHAQGVFDQPRDLLRQAGYSVLEIPDAHMCCGSAGVYNILQPRLAKDLRDHKINSISELKPDVIASGNIGCIKQLQQATDIPVVHTVELIDWALGGACPKGLEQLKDKVTDVGSLYRDIPQI